MPLTLDQKRRLISSHGLNPDEYDVDASEENIIPLPPKSPQPSGDVSTTVNLPKASTPAPSMLDTARRGATQSLFPTAAGLGATAATLALLPEPFISKIGAAGAGLAAILAGTGASIGASKLQEKVVPDEVQKNLFLRPEDMEQNKYTSILSGLAPSLLAFKPNLSDVGELIGGVQALPRVATAGSSALTQNQLNALINAGANVVPSAGMYGYDVATGQRDFNLGELAAETLPGALLTRPTGIGKALGFKGPTEAPAKPKTITEKTATPDISTLPPEEILRGIVKQFGVVPDATEFVPKGKAPKAGKEVPFKSAKESASVFEQQGYNPELLSASEAETQKIAKAREEEGIRAKKMRDAAFTQAEAEAEIQVQRAEATRIEAERLKKENEQRKLDIAVGVRKGFGEEISLAERLKSSVESNRLKGPTVEEIVARYGDNPPDYVAEGLQRDYDKAVQKAKTDEEIRKVEGLKRTIEAVKRLKDSYPTPEIVKGETKTTKIPATSKDVTLDTRYKAEEPTTGFMQPLESTEPKVKFNNKLNDGKGYYQEKSDLPPLDSTPIESLPSGSKAKIKNEILRVARLRNQRVKYVDSLKNPKTGKEVLGQFDPDTNEMLLNKQLFIGTTGPHETSHGRVIDFLNSGDKRDNDLVLRGLEFADERNRKFKSPEDFKKLPTEEQLAIEERFVSTLGQEGYRRIRTDLFGKRRERFGEWVDQVKNHFKTKFGIASPEELRGHFIERQMYDAHDNERVGGGVKVEGTGGKDVEGEKRNQEQQEKDAGDFFTVSSRMLRSKNMIGLDYEKQHPIEQLKGTLFNKILPIEQELLKNSGIDKLKGKMSPRELENWIKENGPKVKVLDYGMEGKVSEAKKEYDRMTHEWFDTLPSKARRLIQDYNYHGTSELYETLKEYYPNLDLNKLKKYEELANKVSSEPQDTSPRATGYYSSISALPTDSPMPEWTKSKLKGNVQRVDVVIPLKGDNDVMETA